MLILQESQLRLLYTRSALHRQDIRRVPLFTPAMATMGGIRKQGQILRNAHPEYSTYGQTVTYPEAHITGTLVSATVIPGTVAITVALTPRQTHVNAG